MAQNRKPPRLYLDLRRRQWVIRDREVFVRTGCGEEDRNGAESALADYVSIAPPAKPPSSLKDRAVVVLGNALERNKWNEKVRKDQGSLVYFITAAHPNFPIKIGFTSSLKELRLQSLQTGCPYLLRLIGAVSGSLADERKIHARFLHLRLVGEWFKSDAELWNFIKNICPESDVEAR